MTGQSEPFLKYVATVTDADNKTLLKMEKYYSKSKWLVKIHDVCSFAHIYSIQIIDAHNTSYSQAYTDESTETTTDKWNIGAYSYGGKTYGGPIEVEFISYDKATDVFCDQPDAKIFCNQVGSGKVFASSYDTGGDNHNPIADDGQWPAKYKDGTTITYLTTAN